MGAVAAICEDRFRPTFRVQLAPYLPRQFQSGGVFGIAAGDSRWSLGIEIGYHPPAAHDVGVAGGVLHMLLEFVISAGQKRGVNRIEGAIDAGETERFQHFQFLRHTF